ncbi:hypothetical protein OH76DRAFT_1418410 [Lentinus brumalis]|uniref:Uncharacterized protein n=1 Tax=Lentinus brumalis TaxID=2498619 RepID=A0A371DA16_9APHY|nr:hypothetical protein OH76DRAFT_1418410 [Polyporus brumalis]
MNEFDFSDSVEGVYVPPARLSQRLPFAPRTTAQGPGVDNIEQYDCEMLWTCGCVRVYFDPDEGGFYHIERHVEATHVVVEPLALAPPIAVFAKVVQPVRTTATKLTRDEPLLVLSKCTHGICAIQVPKGPSDLVFADLLNAPSPSPRSRKRGSVARSSPHPDDKQPSPIAGPLARPKGKGKAVCVAPPKLPVDEPEQEKLPSRASPSSPKDCDPFVCGIDACTEDFPSEEAWEAPQRSQGAARVAHHLPRHEPKSEELYKKLGKRPRTKGKSTAPTKSKSKAPTKSRVATQSSTRTRTAAASVAGPSRTRRRKDSTDENAYGEDEDQEEAPEDSGSEWEERPKKKKLSASPYSCPALSRGHQFAEVYAKVYENGVGAKPRKSRWRSSSL